ncbi:MAG TPA: lactonase family protein [Terriglobia bacterium]|nr:lactonase family protein [Terriglobia bacterium]
MWRPTVVVATIALLLITPGARGADNKVAKGQYWVYVGTYTGPKSKGVYAYRFDASTGQLVSRGLVAESVNPSFLAVDPSRRFLYAVNEVADYQGRKSGGVSAFAINPHTGALTFLNEVASGGPGPCHVSLDKTGKYVLVANYDGGSVAAFPRLAHGRLGEASAFIQHTGHSVNPQRQQGPHAHCILTSPDNRFALAADLGLDQLLVYRFDPAHGTLAPHDPPFAKADPGAGPRHFAFHPSGRFAYLINEIGSSVTAFSYDEGKGALHKLQTISTLPKDFKGANDCAEIAVSGDGRFLYGSNRGHNSIAVFAIETLNGTLTPVEFVSTQGKTPRNFAIDPTGAYLFAANQDSDTIVVFHIDPNTGRLTPTGPVLDAPSPVCVTFVASGGQ